jgi:hypothetical protein
MLTGFKKRNTISLATLKVRRPVWVRAKVKEVPHITLTCILYRLPYPCHRTQKITFYYIPFNVAKHYFLSWNAFMCGVMLTPPE